MFEFRIYMDLNIDIVEKHDTRVSNGKLDKRIDLLSISGNKV